MLVGIVSLRFYLRKVNLCNFFPFLHVNREEVTELAAVAVSKNLSGPGSTKWQAINHLAKTCYFRKYIPAIFRGPRNIIKHFPFVNIFNTSSGSSPCYC